MSLVRYNPWKEMNTLQRQLNQLFDDGLLTNLGQELKDLTYVPSAELSETDDSILLKLELPGMKSEDLDIQVTKEAVYISGERKQETKSEENGVTRTEFRYGKFSRSIALPALVNNNNVTANYQEGILTLTLPKAEEEKNKVVKINLG
ncbi:Hsp20/alpha crystallin family protein [Aphanothece sacrum]|uniref:Heat shock protein Hsp20 n=1 Tax=Aphanothece sacrum FPU1 TaxID=1920663 RepID=A0A401IFE9_APHSA|nr:Hsp20/alpha crystallin family protein [Aphanothece sacrum]GBF79951.1 heat shock protein Hsp20 [Aphanothece sacrum FPU1]GBF83829.1 heat shock protein Hsp20 [Aphanothece sacrum FPU3]